MISGKNEMMTYHENDKISDYKQALHKTLLQKILIGVYFLLLFPIP
jgi:hypothetical protein